MVVDELKGARVLVAGGSGFIGQALVSYLSSLGCSLTTVGYSKNQGGKRAVRHHSLNVAERQALLSTFANEPFDIVFNLSGYIDHSRFDANGRIQIESHYMGAVNLIELAYQSKAKKFIQVGSSDEYGRAQSPLTEDLREQPIASYSAAKAGVTHLIQSLARTEGFPGTVARLFLVYGPNQGPNRLIPQIINSVLSGREVPVSKGEQLRDFCYVDDVARGLALMAVHSCTNGEVFNIASGQPVTVRHMIEKVISSLGTGSVVYGALPYRPGESMSLYASMEKARTQLGFFPEISLDDGIARTVQWYRTLQ